MPKSWPEKFNLGELDAERFLAEYWQRQPLLVRQALPDFKPPIDADELAGLACEPLAESRLVFGPDQTDSWSVEFGPFDERRFEQLPETHFSLLVQDVDKWDCDVADLLDCFEFVPSWRLDDIMISYAAPGGSVGPHIDHYDVFLLQAQGRRCWQIDRQQTQSQQTQSGDLKLVETFTASDEWVLNPGDMLYLPPGIAHYGVASDECLTYSIGMRAPSQSELLLDYAQYYEERSDPSNRYKDPVDITVAAGFVGPQAIASAGLMLKESGPTETDLSLWFAEYMSRYRMVHPIAKPDRVPALSELRELVALGHALLRNPWARFTWIKQDQDTALLFASGERFSTRPDLAQLCCKTRRLERTADLLQDPAAAELFSRLLASGYWRIERL